MEDLPKVNYISHHLQLSNILSKSILKNYSGLFNLADQFKSWVQYIELSDVKFKNYFSSDPHNSIQYYPAQSVSEDELKLQT